MSSYRESHRAKGADYSASFEAIPHRALIWELEQAILHRILMDHFSDKPVRYLDFATGTGRILHALEDRVDEATGVDISASMLQDARARVDHAEIIEADLTANDVLGDRTFDLITTFRFFPNAEQGLRDAVMPILIRHLAPGGVLVFNNHQNAGSLVKRINRLRGLSGALEWASDDVEAFIASNGLEVLSRHAAGVLPFTERHMPAPPAVVNLAETVLGRVPGSHRLAQDIIYVCRRNPADDTGKPGGS